MKMLSQELKEPVRPKLFEAINLDLLVCLRDL